VISLMPSIFSDTKLRLNENRNNFCVSKTPSPTLPPKKILGKSWVPIVSPHLLPLDIHFKFLVTDFCSSYVGPYLLIGLGAMGPCWVGERGERELHEGFLFSFWARRHFDWPITIFLENIRQSPK
jgi:hypothetical protein